MEPLIANTQDVFAHIDRNKDGIRLKFDLGKSDVFVHFSRLSPSREDFHAPSTKRPVSQVKDASFLAPCRFTPSTRRQAARNTAPLLRRSFAER